MASWKLNPIMEWSDDGGSTWHKISDHGRSPLNVQVERIENQQRMADGTMRRYTIAKKRTLSCSWENIPDKSVALLANGEAGDWMEGFHDDNDGMFYVRLREGSDRDTTFTGLTGEVLQVMMTEFSKEVIKRGPLCDLWNLDVTLEEV